jgi:glycosyltransferase involved in cell wall biosynthesis
MSKSSLFILYGDSDFDGRAKRMLEMAEFFGPATILDASVNPLQAGHEPSRRRVVLRSHWGPVRRHIVFWSQVIREVFRRRPDVVYAQNFFSTLPAWVAARLTGARFIYDAYELIVPEPGKKFIFRDRFWYLLERLTVPRADLVIAANRERAEIMAEHYHLLRQPTYMRNIPQWVEVTSDQQAAAIEMYPVLRKTTEDEITIIYQGDVSFRRRLDIFIDVMVILPANYRLIVVGDGADAVRLAQMASAQLAKDRFSALGRVPNDLLPSITVQADIGIVSYSYDGWNNLYCAPNKVFEYAFAGLPVIASSQPTLKSLVSELKIGKLFELEDEPAVIADKILSINGKLTEEDVGRLLASYNNAIEVKRVRRGVENIWNDPKQ